MANTQTRYRRQPPPAQDNGQANGNAPGAGASLIGKKKKRGAAISAMAGNELKTTEDLASYLNLGRTELFAMGEELDMLAAEFHSAAVMLRKRLLRAASKTQDRREKWVYRMAVRKSLRPFFRAAKAAAAASDHAAGSARLLRRFYRSYMEITESLVPKRRGER